MANTYWDNNGEAQAQYEEMQAAGWEYNQTTKNLMRRYYRYYNDGDAPAYIRYLNNPLTRKTSRDIRALEAYEAKLEAMATERILAEYKRFQKAQG